MTRIEAIEARMENAYAPPAVSPLVLRDMDYLISEVKRMREALNRIDAIVPPIPHLPACSAPALRGILERIGGLITAALKGTQS